MRRARTKDKKRGIKGFLNVLQSSTGSNVISNAQPHVFPRIRMTSPSKNNVYEVPISSNANLTLSVSPGDMYPATEDSPSDNMMVHVTRPPYWRSNLIVKVSGAS